MSELTGEQSGEPEAIALEDENALDHVGDEAEAPAESGEPPTEETAPDLPDEVPWEPDTDSLTYAWRAAGALLALRREVDARWPRRSRLSDGTIGDPNHCGPGRPPSDHCPNSKGVVRALDVTADGIRAGLLAEHIRRLGAKGDSRLADGGYVIFNGRIASWSHDWKWRAYTGSNPHRSHLHVSVTRNASDYDAARSWGVQKAQDTNGTGTSSPSELPRHPLGSRVLRMATPRMRGTDVAFVQRWVGTEDHGRFGTTTEARVRRFQGIAGLEPDGVVGAGTWSAMRVGDLRDVNLQKLRDLDIPDTAGVDFDDAPGLKNPWSRTPDDHEDED